MNRAYSLLTVKAVDEDQRLIEGIATTPAPDRLGDIVEPKGAEFTLPLPLLWQHDSSQPIGHVTKATVTADGISVIARLAKVDEPGPLKDRLDEAWQSLKAGLVRGLSIGFKAIESTKIEGTWSYRFVKWMWLELSAVTIPANQEATIQTLKSIDHSLRGAPAREQPVVVRLNPAGVAATTQPLPKKGNQMKISEKIARFEEKRAANMARIAAIHEETDESLNEQQLEEIKNLEAEITTIDRDLPSLKRVEVDLAKTAKPVRAVETDPAAPLAPTPGVSAKSPPKLAPGIAFTRLVKVKMASKLDNEPTLVMAQRMYGADSEIARIIQKAAVPAGTTVSGNWASFLVGDETGMFADFAEFLRPATIVGRFGQNGIPSLRQVPFRLPLISQTGGGAAYWVGEGKPKPLTSITGARTTLEPLKIANIAVLTEESIRDSSPSSEMIVRDTLRDAIVAGVDVAFVDPTNAGSAAVKPASITNGAASIVSTGTDADAVRLDVRAVFQKFIDGNNPPSTGVWLMSSSTALALSLMLNPLGQREFPSIGMMGGTFEGLPVIVSDHISDYVILVNATDIYIGDEGGVAVDMSREASLEMLDSALQQDATTGTGASLVSMFQTNSVALRAERTINWKRRRDVGLAYLTSVAWGGAVPAS